MEYKVWDKKLERYLSYEELRGVCLFPCGKLHSVTIKGGRYKFADITDDVVIEFSIGELDDNDVKLFAGDRVKTTYMHNNAIRTGIVSYHKGAWRIEKDFDGFQYYHEIKDEDYYVEKVGTVHDEQEADDE